MKPLRRFTLYCFIGSLATWPVTFLRVNLGFDRVPYSFVIGLGLAYLWGAETLVEGEKFRFPPVLRWITVTFAFSVFLSTLFASQPDLNLSIRYTLYILSPLLIAAQIRERRTLRQSTVLFVLSSLAIFLYGVYGYVTGQGGIASEHSLGYFGVHYLPSTRNSDALYFEGLFFLTLAYSVVGDKSRKWERLASAAVAVVSLAAIGATLSRGAWISVALGLLAIWVALRNLGWQRLHRQFRVARGIMFAVFVIGVILLSTMPTKELLVNRFKRLVIPKLAYQTGIKDRLNILKGTISIINNHVLLGVGAGNFANSFASLGIPTSHSRVLEPENAYLQAWAEQGLLGFLALSSMVMFILQALYHRLKASMHSSDQWVGVGLFGFMMSCAIHMLFNPIIEELYFWTALGLAASFISFLDKDLTAHTPFRGAPREESQIKGGGL